MTLNLVISKLILMKLKILFYIKNERNKLILYSLLILLGALIAIVSFPNLDAIYASHLEINTTKLTVNIYVIYGSTGNVILSIGDDGVILVDDQYAPVTERIKSVIANLLTNQ